MCLKYASNIFFEKKKKQDLLDKVIYKISNEKPVSKMRFYSHIGNYLPQVDLKFSTKNLTGIH